MDFFLIYLVIRICYDSPFFIRTLCVPHTASNEVIKANYRKLAKLVHPDKCEHEDAAEAFKSKEHVFVVVLEESQL